MIAKSCHVEHQRYMSIPRGLHDVWHTRPGTRNSILVPRAFSLPRPPQRGGGVGKRPLERGWRNSSRGHRYCSSSTLALFYSCYQYSSITFARHFLTLFISFALAKRVHVSIILLFAPRIVSFFANKFYCISLMEQDLSTNPSELYGESPCYIVWCKILIN